MQTKSTLSLSELQASFARGLLMFEDDAIVPFLRVEKADDADRFAIYRGNMVAIWTKALSNAYPVIMQLVGDEFFEELARAYGRAYPSTQGDLNFFGAGFSEFLAGVPALQDYQYMPAVAELEWQMHCAYYSVSAAEPLSLPTFLSKFGDGVQHARLKFASHASLFKSDCAAVPIWQAHQTVEFEGLPENLQKASYAMVVRPQWRVELLSLDEAAFNALQSLQRGDTLEQALDCAMQIDPQFDVGRQLQLWFSAGLFSA